MDAPGSTTSQGYVILCYRNDLAFDRVVCSPWLFEGHDAAYLDLFTVLVGQKQVHAGGLGMKGSLLSSS